MTRSLSLWTFPQPDSLAFIHTSHLAVLSLPGSASRLLLPSVHRPLILLQHLLYHRRIKMLMNQGPNRLLPSNVVDFQYHQCTFLTGKVKLAFINKCLAESRQFALAALPYCHPSWLDGRRHPNHTRVAEA